MYTSPSILPMAEDHSENILSEMPSVVKLLIEKRKSSPEESQKESQRPAPKFRVLLVDRHTLFLEAIGALLRPDYDVTCLALNKSHDVLANAVKVRPDIVVLNPMVGGFNHIGLLREVREIMPSAKILYLAEAASLPLAAAAFANGVFGFLVKNSSIDDFMTALHSLEHEERFLDPKLAEGKIDVVLQFQSPIARLTPREIEVLGLLLRGWSMKQVARELNVTPRTVAFHKYRAMQTLEVQNNAQLIEVAARLGLLGPE